jgi:hypothetical protein
MLSTNPERAVSCALLHCGEYRVIYHKNNGNRFFLSFEAKYPNPEGNMLSTNPERAVSCALFCKFIFTKPLIFESTLSVFNKLLDLKS